MITYKRISDALYCLKNRSRPADSQPLLDMPEVKKKFKAVRMMISNSMYVAK